MRTTPARALIAASVLIILAGCLQQSTGTTNPALRISLGAPKQLMSLGQSGIMWVPDEHTAPIQQPDGSYLVLFAANTSTYLFSTKDFLNYSPIIGTPKTARAVLGPSCDGIKQSCLDNYDADYAGASAAFRSSDGRDLLMIYHAENHYFGGVHRTWEHFYATLGLARSADNGATWTREGGIISGSDPKPSISPPSGVGASEPGAIIADGYIYVFYTYAPSPGYPDQNDKYEIQVARAPVSGDGAPGTWLKYYNGSFSQPGLGGQGSPVIDYPDFWCAQPWPAYSTYLKEYVLVYICGHGWYFSTSKDLVHWTQPTGFFQANSASFFVSGLETDEDVTLVTPGDPPGVIGQSGYVLYANTPAWAQTPHELWMRPFNFTE